MDEQTSGNELSQNGSPTSGADLIFAALGLAASLASHFLSKAFFAQVDFVDPDGHWPSQLYLKLLYADAPQILVGTALIINLYYGTLITLQAKSVLRRILGDCLTVIRSLTALVCFIGLALVFLGIFGLVATSSTGNIWITPYW